MPGDTGDRGRITAGVLAQIDDDAGGGAELIDRRVQPNDDRHHPEVEAYHAERRLLLGPRMEAALEVGHEQRKIPKLHRVAGLFRTDDVARNHSAVSVQEL